jgi:microcin C transport system ATP-binding protein
VIGESGSGKSTLAQAVLGLLPFSGELGIARLPEQNAAKSDSAGQLQAWSRNEAENLPLRRAVQVVFQDPFSSLSPRMTVEEIVGEGLRVHAPSLNTAQRQAKVLEALNDVGLAEAQFPNLLSRYPHEFSGGQRQRLAIARALIVEPQVLVLDEPTSALDVTIQKQVIELLQNLQRSRGLAFLLITHDVDVIRAMAHRVLVMKDGQIVEQGETLALWANAQHPYTQILMKSA